jgi:branched-subunit amino acid transport protein
VLPGDSASPETLPRMAAAIVAAVVAWRLRSPLGAIVVGMVALWIGKAIMPV